jgi:hypothetical protein
VLARAIEYISFLKRRNNQLEDEISRLKQRLSASAEVSSTTAIPPPLHAKGQMGSQPDLFAASAPLAPSSHTTLYSVMALCSLVFIASMLVASEPPGLCVSL